jgi:hypothetical protein
MNYRRLLAPAAIGAVLVAIACSLPSFSLPTPQPTVALGKHPDAGARYPGYNPSQQGQNPEGEPPQEPGEPGQGNENAEEQYAQQQNAQNQGSPGMPPGMGGAPPTLNVQPTCRALEMTAGSPTACKCGVALTTTDEGGPVNSTFDTFYLFLKCPSDTSPEFNVFWMGKDLPLSNPDHSPITTVNNTTILTSLSQPGLSNAPYVGYGGSLARGGDIKYQWQVEGGAQPNGAGQIFGSLQVTIDSLTYPDGQAAPVTGPGIKEQVYIPQGRLVATLPDGETEGKPPYPRPPMQPLHLYVDFGGPCKTNADCPAKTVCLAHNPHGGPRTCMPDLGYSGQCQSGSDCAAGSTCTGDGFCWSCQKDYFGCASGTCNESTGACHDSNDVAANDDSSSAGDDNSSNDNSSNKNSGNDNSSNSSKTQVSDEDAQWLFQHCPDGYSQSQCIDFMCDPGGDIHECINGPDPGADDSGDDDTDSSNNSSSNNNSSNNNSKGDNGQNGSNNPSPPKSGGSRSEGKQDEKKAD